MSQTERWDLRASSLVNRLKGCLTVRDWAWWQLPVPLKTYVAAPIVLTVAVAVIGGLHTTWRLHDAETFLLLLICGSISHASTPRIAYTSGGGLTRDFSSIWVLPTAILLPPVYALVIPIPFIIVMQIWVHRGVVHRRAFTAAATGLSYAGASWLFRLFPASFAGSSVGAGRHALTWCLAVAAVELVGSRVHHFMILFAIKLSDPRVRIWRMDFNRDAWQGLFVEIDLGVLITLAVGLSQALVLIAAPTVLLVRRFLVHPMLVAQSRVDSKTGLLNVSTWEWEAENELSRSVRLHNSVAVAIVDIDHFKIVNDTYGHLIGDRVLKAIAEALTGQSRDYDRVGRFGGEEFVLLLAQTGEADACQAAERLRGYIAALDIPVDDRPDAPTLKVTISIGVTALERGEAFELTDMLAAADSAMYAAKQAGRNRVAFAPPLRDMGLDAAWDSAEPGAEGASASAFSSGQLSSSPLTSHRVVLVQTEHTAASLCPRRSLSVP